MRLGCWRKKKSYSLFVQEKLYKHNREERNQQLQPSQAQDCVCIFAWWLPGGELGGLRLESILLFL